MIVLHVENQELTRVALANALGVQDDRLRHLSRTYDYVSTAMVHEARKQIQVADSVKVLVLDIGLDPGWDSRHMMRVLLELLRRMEGEPPRAGEPESCAAVELAHVAKVQGVSCALLTNYADYVGNPIGEGKDQRELKKEHLPQIFRAGAMFLKNASGFADCAEWVRGKL